MTTDNIAQKFTASYSAGRRIDTGHKFGKPTKANLDAFASHRQKQHERRVHSWHKLNDASKVKGGFDYDYLIGHNLDVWYIEYAPLKTNRDKWIAYCQFASFRFTVDLWQEDIDYLNTLLGWTIGKDNYLPSVVYHWIIPRKYDAKWGLSGIAGIWLDNRCLFHGDILEEMKRFVVPEAKKFIAPEKVQREPVVLSPHCDNPVCGPLPKTVYIYRETKRPSHRQTWLEMAFENMLNK